ncbi:MAG: hypothetical protein KAI71_00780 [Candidatus Pacebacteria bacterium]|nr:hypothetical protein [Candidatus Paceibacterota bacterium]
MLESIYLSILLAGFGGGAVRGLVGFTKHQFSYKNVGFNLPYFVAMMLISGVTGLLSAIVVRELGITFLELDYTPAVAFIVGYAGGDFLENLYKIIIKEPSIYKIKK